MNDELEKIFSGGFRSCLGIYLEGQRTREIKLDIKNPVVYED
jgi:hypothetical protein